MTNAGRWAGAVVIATAVAVGCGRGTTDAPETRGEHRDPDDSSANADESTPPASGSAIVPDSPIPEAAPVPEPPTLAELPPPKSDAECAVLNPQSPLGEG